MRRLIFLLAMVGMAAAAHAQQVVDGSDKDFDYPVAKKIAENLDRVTADPYSVQIKGLRKSSSDPQDVCGMINMKNGFGAYSGFQPFIIYAGTFYLQSADQCR